MDVVGPFLGQLEPEIGTEPVYVLATDNDIALIGGTIATPVIKDLGLIMKLDIITGPVIATDWVFDPAQGTDQSFSVGELGLKLNMM
jgi:hypothetical protein